MYAREAAAAKQSSLERYIALSLWLLVAALFFSLAGQWILLNSSDKKFSEYVEGVLRRSTFDRHSPTEIRSLVMLRAAELSLPVTQGGITIRREGNAVRAMIDYDAEILLPFLNIEWNFDTISAAD
jgi:hypothetical protein